MNQKIILFSIALLPMIFIGCSKNNENKDQLKDPNKFIQKKVNIELTIPIQKVDKLSVENFVKIYLSRMEHEIKWAVDLQGTIKNGNVTESSSVEKEDAKEFLEKKEKLDKEFFSSWGISQEKFEQFALERDSEIQEYIENHIEIQDFIDKIQEKNKQLYDMNDNEDDNPANDKNTKPNE